MKPSGQLSVRGSVRNRLLFILLGGVALVWLAAAAVTAWETRSEMQELLDAHLAQSAALLAAQIGDEIDEVELEHVETLHKYARNVAFQIWEDGDKLLLHSPDAPMRRLSGTQEGFSDAVVDGRSWRVFSHWDDKREYLVQVGEATDARDRLAGKVLEKLVQPLLVALPLLGLLVWFGVGGALKPINRIGAALARRDPHHLAPLEGEVPKEIAPMVERLNALLARVAATLENERRFTSDAAHELRTPLAALKTQLQVAQGAADGGEREQAIAKAIAAGDRATRLVEQLLTLARLEHDTWKNLVEAVDLHRLAAQALSESAQAAADKKIRLSLEGEPGLMIAGHAGLLAILLRNLIDNALRYSPPDTDVTVGVHRMAGQIWLEVQDQGPGIPPEERDNAQRRFHRLEGAQAGGSGLGLSIVARIAELHGARVELREGPQGRGLKACIVFAETAGKA
ncbi:two-component sensor histidine kinase [Betaproteobacteria bacterium SCN2]|nr:two-component sensor histidine kinase [Betaproteobacteria bacterium SCN2]